MALSFAEKNRLLVKHKNPEYFHKDLELFKKHYAGHNLNNELANVTKFTKGRLSEQILYLLLDKLSIDEILENRGIKPPKELTYDEKAAIVLSKYGESYIVKNTDDLKNIATMLGHPEPESLGVYTSLVGKPIKDLLFDPEDDDLDKELDDDKLGIDPEGDEVGEDLTDGKINESNGTTQEEGTDPVNTLEPQNPSLDNPQANIQTEGGSISENVVSEDKTKEIDQPSTPKTAEVETDKKKGAKAKSSPK